jgi:hypothetical protein
MDPLSYESVLNLAPTIFQDNLSTLATAFGGVKKSAVMIRELSLPRVSGLPWPKRRAHERTRTADLLITSDRSGVAQECTTLQSPHI